MKNAVVCLAVDKELLKVQLANMPQIDADYIVCVETRCGVNIFEIKALVGDQINGRPALVIDSRTVVDHFSKILDTPFLHSYTMGMNILLQWYMFSCLKYDKVLFIEEDVILTADINKIFDEDHCLFYTWKMASHVKAFDQLKGISKLYVDAFSSIFNLQYTADTYLDVWKGTHIASGQRLYVRNTFDLDYYTECLKRYFSNETLASYWENRRTHRTGYLDERFEGFFAYTSGILNNGIAKYTYIEIAKPTKVDISKYKGIAKCGGIWHNATVSQKHIWCDELRKHNKIK